MPRFRPLAVILLVLAQLFAGTSFSQEATPSSDVLTLQAGDLIRVQIWREEDLSGEFLVDPRGVVTLPLLGDLEVTHIPMGALRDTLTERYRTHLRNPSISVTPLRRINVLGEVQKPGIYSVDPTISLAGAVALAGGATSAGDLNRIRVVRQGADAGEPVAAAAVLDSVDIRSGDQILVGRRSWFDRNSTFVVSALLSISSIVISLTR
jgi:protein involved in polysaccharide export with SLBB domain